jgi:outer membrane protein TolC
LPIDTSDRFSLTRDFMTMRKIGLMQEFPRKEKRRLRSEAANADVEKERAQLAAERLNVRRETAMAWIERYLADRERELLLNLRKESDLVVSTSEAALRGGKGNSGDVLAAKSDRTQLDDRLDTAARDVAQATASLARWIGPDAAERPLAEPPDFAGLSAAPEALLTVSTHAALQTFVPMEARATTDVALARAEKKPDWSVEFAYAQRGPAYSNMISVEFQIDLPVFAGHRQDPEIAAKLAQLDRVHAEREETERAQREETTKLLAAWTTAQKRLTRTRDELLPLGEQRVAATLASYRSGRADLQAVIAARKAQIDANMTYVTQLGDLARAWAALNYLIADKELP